MDVAIVAGFLSVIVVVALTWRMFQPAPRLQIGERGILDRAAKLGWVRWDEIEGAYLRRSEEPTAVFLRLRITERLARRLRRAEPRQAPSVGQSFDLRLDLADTGFTAVELVQEIMAHSERPAPAREPAGWPRPLSSRRS